MTKYRLTHDHALGGFDAKADGAHLTEQTGFAIIAVTMANGGKRGFNTTMKKLFGMPAPEANQMVISGKTRIIASALDQVFVVEKTDPETLEAKLVKGLGKHATFTNQSDGWVVLEYAGPRVHEGMERISLNDTSIDAFPIGGVMRASIEHVNGIICREKAKKGEVDRFLLLTQRSSAASFVHGIIDTVPFIED